MKMLKRNQIIIMVIALMLVSAGYLNYSSLHKNDEIPTSAQVNETQYAAIGDAKLVSSNGIEEDVGNTTSIENAISNTISSTNEINVVESTIETNNIVNNTTTLTNSIENTKQTNNDVVDIQQYFTSSKLNRDKMYSQMIESYQKILENENISSDQKAIAQTEIKNINDTKNAIMIAENLIKLKDFEDVMILVNEESINVVIKATELSQEQIAQVQNIVSRELKAELTNIHISTKSA